MPQSSPVSSCTICGSFTLNNATIILPTQSFEFSDVVVYDTMIKASYGPPMTAKLFISGRQTYPEGSVICAVVKGGPVYPRGYLLHVSSFLSPMPNPPLYRDLLRRSRINATGTIISTSRIGDEDIYFDIEMTNQISSSPSSWTLRHAPIFFRSVAIDIPSMVHRCIVPLSIITFTPALNEHVNVLGLIHCFVADYGRRRMEVDVSIITRSEF